MKKIFLLTLACLIMSGYAFAQSEEKKSQEGTPSNEFTTIRLANDLATYGYQNNSASSLVEAAKILMQISTQKFVPEKTEKGAETQNETAKVDKPKFTAENLLADAKELAVGDANLLAVIASVEKTIGDATRGAYGGPKISYDRVLANSIITYSVTFNAGLLAEVGIIGDGDTDLDLYIYDLNGNLIVADTGYSDSAYVSFFPYYTVPFTIKVVNRGKVYNNFTIMTN